jgi:hypothetical protein
LLRLVASRHRLAEIGGRRRGRERPPGTVESVPRSKNGFSNGDNWTPGLNLLVDTVLLYRYGEM